MSHPAHLCIQNLSHIRVTVHATRHSNGIQRLGQMCRHQPAQFGLVCTHRKAPTDQHAPNVVARQATRRSRSEAVPVAACGGEYVMSGGLLEVFHFAVCSTDVLLSEVEGCSLERTFALLVRHAHANQHCIAQLKMAEQIKLVGGQCFAVQTFVFTTEQAVDQLVFVHVVMRSSRLANSIADLLQHGCLDLGAGGCSVTQLSPVVFATHKAVNLRVTPNCKVRVQPLSEADSQFGMKPCTRCAGLPPTSNMGFPHIWVVALKCCDVVQRALQAQPLCWLLPILGRSLCGIEPAVALQRDHVAEVVSFNNLSHNHVHLSRETHQSRSSGVDGGFFLACCLEMAAGNASISGCLALFFWLRQVQRFAVATQDCGTDHTLRNSLWQHIRPLQDGLVRHPKRSGCVRHRPTEKVDCGLLVHAAILTIVLNRTQVRGSFCLIG